MPDTGDVPLDVLQVQPSSDNLVGPQLKDHLDTMINMDMPHSPGTGMGSHMTGTDSPMGGMWR